MVRFPGLASVYQQLVFNVLSGTIKNFRNQQRRLYEIGTIGIMRSYYTLPGAKLMYTNINGTEIIDVRIADRVINSLRRRVRRREAIIYLNFIDEVYVLEGVPKAFDDIIVGAGAVGSTLYPDTAVVDSEGLVVHVWDGVVEDPTLPVGVGDFYTLWAELFTHERFAAGVTIVTGSSAYNLGSIGSRWLLAYGSSFLQLVIADNSVAEEAAPSAATISWANGENETPMADIAEHEIPVPDLTQYTGSAVRVLRGETVAISVGGGAVGSYPVGDLSDPANPEVFGEAVYIGNVANAEGGRMRWLAVYHADDMLESDLRGASGADFVPWLRDEVLDPVPDVGKGIFDVNR